MVGSDGDSRGGKWERSERGVGHQSAPSTGGLNRGYSGVSPRIPRARPVKKGTSVLPPQ